MCSTSFGLLLTVFSLGISGCQLLVAEPPAPAIARLNENTTENSPTQNPVAFLPSTATAANTVTVQRYKIDAQCQALEPIDLEVAADAPLDSTVETIVGDRSNGDFRITDHRLKIDISTKTATIDFRLPIDSPRSLHSLSNCEQLALLGELRQTLIANAAWDIDTVNFQVQGQDVPY